MRVALLLVLLLAAACSRKPVGIAPHQIRLVGASAGLPFAEDVAERFTLASADAIAPLAQADGSASGIARFCGGLGARHPDLAIATRPMSFAERRECAVHGVTRIAELRFGWSATVLVARPGEGPRGLSLAQANVAVGGQARNWSEIAPGLPPVPITLYGPARFAADGGMALPIRRDGSYHPLGADADLIAGTVARTPGAIGILPYAYTLRPGLRPIPLDGVMPNAATIATGRYPMRMPLFLLVKEGEAPGVRGMPALLRLFGESLDPGGAFAALGLVPLDRAGREQAKRTLASIGHAA